MMHGSTTGRFLFEGIRRDSGVPQEVSGMLVWKASPMADSSDRAVSVKMRVRADVHPNLDFDPIPPDAFGEHVHAVAKPDLVRRLGAEDPDAWNDLIRLIDTRGRGFDIQADNDSRAFTLRDPFRSRDGGTVLAQSITSGSREESRGLRRESTAVPTCGERARDPVPCSLPTGSWMEWKECR